MENTRRSKHQVPKKSNSFKQALANIPPMVKAKPKVAGGIAAALAVAVLAGSAVGLSGTKGLDENVAVSKWVHFDSIKAVDGFSTPSPRTDVGSSPLTSKQTTGSVTNDDESCTFSGQVSHIPSYNEGRGDKYLTQEYLYELTENNNHLVVDFDKVKIATDQGKLEALSTNYPYETTSYNTETEKEETITQYRSVAVRVIDNLIDIENFDSSTKGLYGSDIKKGLPIVTLNYDCDTEDAYDQKEWERLVSSVHIKLDAQESPEYDVSETSEAGLEEDRAINPDIKSTDETITLTEPEESVSEPTGNDNAVVPEFIEESAGVVPLDGTEEEGFEDMDSETSNEEEFVEGQ